MSGKPGYVLNPASGRLIKIGGPKYKELTTQGVKFSQSPQKAQNAQKKQAGADSVAKKSVRKSPAISATLLSVGTEKQGSDGLYIVRLRTNGSQYWARCANKGSNCKTKQAGQSGGNPMVMLAALPALADLAIPAGLTAASYAATEYWGQPKVLRQTGGGCSLQSGGGCSLQTGGGCSLQTGGNFPLLMGTLSDLVVPVGLIAGSHWLAGFQARPREQTGGDPMLFKTLADLTVPVALTLGALYFSKEDGKKIIQAGGDLPMINDPFLTPYLTYNGINLVSPSTLIPLGILLAVYAAYRKVYVGKPIVQTGGLGSELNTIVDKDDVAQYKRKQGIREITPETRFPFATLMGGDVFKQYVKSL
jgi:hypothetical protein